MSNTNEVLAWLDGIYSGGQLRVTDTNKDGVTFEVMTESNELYSDVYSEIIGCEIASLHNAYPALRDKIIRLQGERDQFKKTLTLVRMVMTQFESESVDISDDAMQLYNRLYRVFFGGDND